MSLSQDGKKTTTWIMFALGLGLAVGLVCHYLNFQEIILFSKPIGDVFIRFLKMMIIPLVLSSIFMSIVNLGSPEELGRMGFKTIIYYFLTTAMAAFVGLIIVNVIQPGSGLDLASLPAAKISESINAKIEMGSNQGLWKTILGVFIEAIPKNPIKAMANSTVLQVIVFAILFGIVALYNRKESEPMINFMKSLEFLSMKLVGIIMVAAPIGIFALMVTVITTSGTSSLMAMGKYISAVLLGLFVHFLVLLFIGSARAKRSPIEMIKATMTPLMTAFSTASSAATLPITMNVVENNLGVDRKTAKFVLPLGATINMDGTALYESVAVIFIGQAYGLDLSIANQVVIFMTASLAAIGAAAIPGAGLITMSIVLSAVGFPLEGIGLILAVDRVLDMFRTAVNVFGDCMGTVVVESFQNNENSIPVGKGGEVFGK